MAYAEAFSSVYDAFTGNVHYKKRADYIMSLLNCSEPSDKLLLDVACGTGVLTEEFIKNGFDVTGVDISPDMLMAARERLLKYGDKVLLLNQDMRELDLFGTVDFAVCSLDSINHLNTKDDVLECFKSVCLFLNPSGRFVFDVNTFYKHEKILSGNTFVYENIGAFLVWQNSECESGNVDIMLDIFSKNPDGTYTRESEDFSESAYAASDIEQLLRKAGFTNIQCYGDMKNTSPAEDEERIYFVADKA